MVNKNPKGINIQNIYLNTISNTILIHLFEFFVEQFITIIIEDETNLKNIFRNKKLFK